jgi:hypothetical protein
MLMLAFLAAASPPAVPQVRAAARIVRPVRISEEWLRMPPRMRRAVIVEEAGRHIKLRLVEFE